MQLSALYVLHQRNLVLIAFLLLIHIYPDSSYLSNILIALHTAKHLLVLYNVAPVAAAAAPVAAVAPAAAVVVVAVVAVVVAAAAAAVRDPISGVCTDDIQSLSLYFSRLLHFDLQQTLQQQEKSS